MSRSFRVIALAVANAILALLVFRQWHQPTPVDQFPTSTQRTTRDIETRPTNEQIAVSDRSTTSSELADPSNTSTKRCQAAFSAWLQDEAASSQWRAENGELALRSSHPYAAYSESDLRRLMNNNDPEAFLEQARRTEALTAESDFATGLARVWHERAAVTGLPMAYLNVADLIERGASTNFENGRIGPEEVAYRREEAAAFRRMAAYPLLGEATGVFEQSDSVEYDADTVAKFIGRYGFFRKDLTNTLVVRSPIPAQFINGTCDIPNFTD